MIKIGITGQSGFIGTHLYNTLSLYKEEFELVPFRDEFFNDDQQLKQFVASCDAIVHLAAGYGAPRRLHRVAGVLR